MPTPLKNMKVSWDYSYSQILGIFFQATNQLAFENNFKVLKASNVRQRNQKTFSTQFWNVASWKIPCMEVYSQENQECSTLDTLIHPLLSLGWHQACLQLRHHVIPARKLHDPAVSGNDTHGIPKKKGRWVETTGIFWIFLGMLSNRSHLGLCETETKHQLTN